MTLNLNKYGSEMQAAWKRVRDVDGDIDWALFGYEGNSYTLRLVATGADGVDELREELNPNQIMYAFVRLCDSKTSLPKFVFLHWQGEGAAGTRKGVCATHMSDIKNYFHGAHLTFNARNEDEVDGADIARKLATVTASQFNFKERHDVADVPAPVGTAHERIVPERELPSLTEREQFWIQEEERERQRLHTEKQRKMSENKLLEEQRRRREEEESRVREAAIKERERKTSQMRQLEQQDKGQKQQQRDHWQAQLQEDAIEEQARQQRSDQLRKARKEEARQLISQRSVDARAVFERHSSVGQLHSRRHSSVASASADTVSSGSHCTDDPASAGSHRSPGDVQPDSKHRDQDDDVLVPPPASFGGHEQQPDLTLSSHAPQQPDLIQDVSESKTAPDVTATEVTASGCRKEDFGVCAVALYDYEAADDNEISFDPGQIVTHIDQIDPGWWQGMAPDGRFGLFPANYVELIDQKDLELGGA